MTEHKDKEVRRLKKAKITVMRSPLFALWSGVMMVGTTEVRDDIPTAATNGRDEYYGRGLIKLLNDKMLAFVVLHENGHKMLRQLTIWKKLFDINPKIANIACDHVVNLMLLEADPNETVIEFPKIDGKPIGHADKRFTNWNAKRIFDTLLEEEDKNGGSGGGGGGGRGEDSEGAGGSPFEDGFDEHDWQGAKDMTAEEKRELERELDEAIRNGQMAHQRMNGNKAGSMSRELGDLLAPKIDWREALAEFVRSMCNANDTSSWRRVNRRFLHSGIYMPSMIGERVERIVVGVDTSGSIAGAELSRFLSEVKAVADNVRPEFLDLYYWDAQVASHEAYDEGNMSTLVASTKPKGGGGTDPRCLMDLLNKERAQPDCIIMLTDGYVPAWGDDWPAPILWVVCNGNNTSATSGKTVHIND